LNVDPKHFNYIKIWSSYRIKGETAVSLEGKHYPQYDDVIPSKVDYTLSEFVLHRKVLTMLTSIITKLKCSISEG